jgi:anti-sigma-K factor RskA
VIVDPTSGEAAVVLAGLGPAPAGRVYELWAIRGERPPEPAGLVSGEGAGPIAARGARVERPGEVTAFAVSIEPAGGSQTPTGPIVLAGAVAG